MKSTAAYAVDFLDRSMWQQEPIIQQYINLIQGLHENCGGVSNALNMKDLHNLTTFYMIGGLAFGEPFGCLERSAYDSWIETISSSPRFSTIGQVASIS